MTLANILRRSCPEIECRGPREVSCGKSFVGRRAGSKTNPGEDARGITVNSWIGGGGESARGSIEIWRSGYRESQSMFRSLERESASTFRTPA